MVFNTISFGIAVINSYFMNKYWAFGTGGSVQTAEVSKFITVSLIGLALNTLVVYVLGTFFILSFRLSVLDPFTELADGLWANLAKLAATAISLVWNFVGYKLFVFKNR